MDTNNALAFFNQLLSNMAQQSPAISPLPSNVHNDELPTGSPRVRILELDDEPVQNNNDQRQNGSPNSNLHSPSTSQTSTAFSNLAKFQDMLRTGIEEAERIKTDIHKSQLEKDRHIEQLKAKIERRNQTMQKLKEEVEKIIIAKDNSIKSLESQQSTLRQELDSIKSAYEFQIKSLQDSLRRSQDEAQRLHASLELARKEREELINNNTANVTLTQVQQQQQSTNAAVAATKLQYERQIETLNATITVLSTEIEQWKERAEKANGFIQNVERASPLNPSASVDQLIGEIKILRARLQSERDESNILRQQIMLSKKRDEEIRKEAMKEVERLKTVIQFKEHEMKSLQQEYDRVVQEKEQQRQRRNSISNDQMMTVEEFVDNVDQSTTPKKRRISSPSRRSRSPRRLSPASPKSSTALFEQHDEDEQSDPSPKKRKEDQTNDQDNNKEDEELSLERSSKMQKVPKSPMHIDKAVSQVVTAGSSGIRIIVEPYNGQVDDS